MTSTLVARSNRCDQRFGVFSAATAISGAAGDVLDFAERHALLGQSFEGVLSQSVTDANEHGLIVLKYESLSIRFAIFSVIDLNRTVRRR